MHWILLPLLWTMLLLSAHANNTSKSNNMQPVTSLSSSLTLKIIQHPHQLGSLVPTSEQVTNKSSAHSPEAVNSLLLPIYSPILHHLQVRLVSPMESKDTVVPKEMSLGYWR